MAAIISDFTYLGQLLFQIISILAKWPPAGPRFSSYNINLIADLLVLQISAISHTSFHWHKMDDGASGGASSDIGGRGAFSFSDLGIVQQVELGDFCNLHSCCCW